MMCSFRFSPVPTPRKKRPGIMAAAVAAACATMAGCTRIGGMHPHRRAGHRRPEPEPCGGEPDRADHAPHERALPLSIDPRVEMIGHHGEAESVLLRHAGEPHQLVRAGLFARELVTNLHQGIPAPRPRPVTRWMMSITTPITKRIQAICEATCATPKSPRSPAMRPTTRKMSA